METAAMEGEADFVNEDRDNWVIQFLFAKRAEHASPSSLMPAICAQFFIIGELPSKLDGYDGAGLASTAKSPQGSAARTRQKKTFCRVQSWLRFETVTRAGEAGAARFGVKQGNDLLLMQRFWTHCFSTAHAKRAMVPMAT
jgi:hypothetical protein